MSILSAPRLLPRVVRPLVGPRTPAYSQIYRFFTTLQEGSSALSVRTTQLATVGRGACEDTLAGGVSKRFKARAYSQQCPDCPRGSPAPTLPTPRPVATSLPTLAHPTYLASLPLSLRRLAANLPSAPGQPPTRDQLLKLTTSFAERLRIRFKWATIRSYRHFRPDDYSAFVIVGMAGTLTWFLISTTSFFAFVFFIINSLSMQEGIARALGNYLTAHTGVTVVFESAIVPKWGLAGGGSKILFKNVYLSRGPAGNVMGVLPPAEEELQDPNDDREGGDLETSEFDLEVELPYSKWTHFHLSIDTVEVSLSLSRWLDGKGLVRNASVTGVRGVVDRSHVHYDPDAPLDRMAYRHVAHPGDFWLENLQIQDFLVTIYQPDNFRPYTFSIFNADIRKLRKQWLFYDLLSADSITGQVDNCLFSLHKPQSIGRTSEEDLKDARWGRMSRFRVDGVPIDHMQTAHDQGVLSWVTSGRCDLVADIRFPLETSEGDLAAIVADIVEIFDKEIGNHLHVGALNSRPERVGEERIPGQRVLKGDALQVPRGWNKDAESAKKRKLSSFEPDEEEPAPEAEDEEEEIKRKQKEANRMVSIDLDIRFKDLKATVPIFTSDFSYVNNALVRPIVAFLNSNRTLIPIRCHFDLSLDEFDGSWTTYDCGLLDRTSEQVYAALAHHVQNANHQRIQTVSLWTLRLTAEAVLSAFKRGWGEAERSGLFIL